MQPRLCLVHHLYTRKFLIVFIVFYCIEKHVFFKSSFFVALGTNVPRVNKLMQISIIIVVVVVELEKCFIFSLLKHRKMQSQYGPIIRQLHAYTSNVFLYNYMNLWPKLCSTLPCNARWWYFIRNSSCSSQQQAWWSHFHPTSYIIIITSSSNRNNTM